MNPKYEFEEKNKEWKTNEQSLCRNEVKWNEKKEKRWDENVISLSHLNIQLWAAANEL